MNLMKYRKFYYLLSGLFVVLGSVSLILWGLKPSIDFTGGSRIEFRGVTDINKVEQFARDNGLENLSSQRIGEDGIILRFKEIDEAKHNEVKEKIRPGLGENVSEVAFETVGPTISKEITRRAFISVAIATLVIIIYVGYSFRKVPYPANSWEFGIMAVLAMLHDVIVLVGAYSILGHFFNIEIDPLFITAVLTVIGFSVHDTIVIFDRIRENLIKKGSEDFEGVTNLSILEMLPRTLNTSFLGWAIILILFLFGGSTIKYFILALVIGTLAGSYSSIFNASPLLVTWQEFKRKRSSKLKS